MKVIRSPKRMQNVARQLKRAGRKIAFVPTMGALHEGHLSLVRRARKLGDVTVVSIFVNPAQFGPHEDLNKYPRSLPADARALRALGVDYLFLPGARGIYPGGFQTWVAVERLGALLEGRSRPTHFRGVATVVAKLFNLVQPDVAVFGRKDFQQGVLVRRLVADLNLPIKIVIAPTLRERSGLAMSSRNRYFDAEQKARASVLYKSLQLARALISHGERRTEKLVAAMSKLIQGVKGTRIDYIAATDEVSLEPLPRLQGRVTISLAVWLDGVRLIDNISLKVDDGK